MKVIVILGLMLLNTTAFDVEVINKCKCTQLLSQLECQYDSTCVWDKQNNLCKLLSETNTIQSGYCESIGHGSVCAKTKGCAYIGTSCRYFAGCSAYQGSSIVACQAISKICISNGEQYVQNI